MAYWFILSLSLNEKVYGDWVQLRLWPTRAPRTSKLRSDVLTAGFILEIGQWESNGPPSVILGGPFSKKSGTRKGAPNPNTLHECFLRLLTFYMGRTRRMLCRHFGTFWATEKAWARTPDNLNLFRFPSKVRVIRSSSYRKLEKNSQE